MKDLKIEYRDGKLVELTVDGVAIRNASSMSLRHPGGAEQPEFTVTMPIAERRSLPPTGLTEPKFRHINK